MTACNSLHLTSMEKIADVLYDRQRYPAEGRDSVEFFGEPIGMNGRTRNDTNMYLSNELPMGQRFLVTAVEVVFLPNLGLSKAARIADINAAARGGVITLRVQHREYMRASPLAACPASLWWFAEESTGGGESTGDGERTKKLQQQIQAQLTEQFRETDYGAFGGRPFDLVPLYIMSGQYFHVAAEFLAPLPSGQSGELWCRLRGYRLRPSV